MTLITDIFRESFETDGAGTRYFPSAPFNDGSNDHWNRTDGTGISVISGPYSGADGTFYWAGEDLDDTGAAGASGADVQVIDFAQIDVSGFTEISFEGLFAAGNANPAGANAYDALDYMALLYSIDGGTTYLPGLIFNYVNANGDAFNEPLALVTAPVFAVSAQAAAAALGDFDGDGDAVYTDVVTTAGDPARTLNAAFAAFSFAIPDAATLDLRLAVHMDAASEEIAFDAFAVTGKSAQPTVINEVVGSTAGTDAEFAELYGAPGASLAGLSLIVVESDAGAANGTIDKRFDFAAGDAIGANGFFLVGAATRLAEVYGATADADFGANFIENSSYTIALVETAGLGAAGTSLTGTETVLDAVGVTDGGADDAFAFGAPVLGPDGTFLPSGVVRVTDGADTDAAADWRLLDAFDVPASGDATPTAAGAAPVGTQISIAPLDAAKAEGDAGTTAFTFALTRAGDVSAAGTVDWAVTGGDADADDFAGAAPSGTATFLAGETEATVTVEVSGDLASEFDESFEVTLSNPSGGATVAGGPATGTILNDDGIALTLIHDIQGAGDASALVGQVVTVEAVVVGDFQGSASLRGFYLQEEDADADADAATSEGIFVFDGAGLANVAAGDVVRVTGTVGEFFGETQLSSLLSVEVVGAGAAVTAAELSFPAVATRTNADGALIADLEAYEGMLVSVPQTLTVSNLFNYGRFGEIGLHADGRLPVFTQINAPDAAAFAAYADLAVRNTVVIDDGRTTQNPDPLIYPDGDFGADDTLSSGDTVDGLTGVVRFGRGSGGSGVESYRINPTESPVFDDANPREATPPEVGGSLRVASFNVLNYFNGDGLGGGFPTARGADTAAELERQADKIVSALTGLDADVVGLIEIENDGYAPTSAIADLVGRLNAVMGAGTYAFVDPGTPTLGSDVIAVGFIYKPESVSLNGDAAVLDKTVDPRFDSDNQRPTLAQTFTEVATGESFTAAVSHFKSKGSSAGNPGDEDAGDGAGASNGTRTEAARALADWLAADPTGAGDPDVLILGDLNAYAMEDPIQAILDGADDARGTADDYANLNGPEAYSFGFPVSLGTAPQTQSFGTLDYALANGSMGAQVSGAAIWNINADEAAVLDYNTEFKPASALAKLYAPDAFRSSDHDAVLVGLDLASEPEFNLVQGTGGNDRLNGTDGRDLIVTGGGRLDIVTGGAGADRFDFSAILGDGTRSTVRIADFEAGEVLVGVSAADVGRAFATGAGFYLQIGDERDVAILSGIDALDQIAFADDLLA